MSNDNLSYIARHYALDRFYRGPPPHQPSGEQHLHADLLEAYVGVFWDTFYTTDEGFKPGKLAAIEQHLLRQKMENYAEKLVSLDVFPDLWDQVMRLYEQQKGNTPWRASQDSGQLKSVDKTEQPIPKARL